MAEATSDNYYQIEGNFYPRNLANLTDLDTRLIWVFPYSNNDTFNPLLISNVYVDEAQDCDTFAY